MALLILRESNNTTRYTSKRPNPRHRPCFATPRSGHITTPRPNSSLARQWGNITMPHLGNTLARYPDSTQAPRPSNTLALHRVNPAPRQIHPRSASGPQRPNAVSGSTPVPHRAHNIPALPRGPSQEPRNKKIGPNCNFFAIGNCCELPNRESRHKNAGNLPCEGPFSLCGDREEFAIAKKLQRCRDFCFHDGRIVPTDRFHDGRITATGGYRRGGGSPQRGKSRRCAYSRRQRGQQRLGSLIGRGAPQALPDRIGRQPVCRGVCCGLDGAAAPRS